MVLGLSGGRRGSSSMWRVSSCGGRSGGGGRWGGCSGDELNDVHVLDAITAKGSVVV